MRHANMLSCFCCLFPMGTDFFIGGTHHEENHHADVCALHDPLPADGLRSRETHPRARHCQACAYTVALVKVPLAFVSGDKDLCEGAVSLNPHAITVIVKEDVGVSTINIHPDLAVEQIRSQVARAVTSASKCLLPLPDPFTVEIRFRRPSVPVSSDSSPAFDKPIPPPSSLTTPVSFKLCASSCLRFKCLEPQCVCI